MARDAESVRERSTLLTVKLKSENQPTARALWIAATLLLASAAVRLAAAGSDLWLDEIWSLHLAETVTSPLDVVTRIRETNNHPLNTLWLSLVGEHATRLELRAPSIFFGIAAVGLGGLLGARRSRVDAWIAMFLLGSSYCMIDTASEARGYAPMAACALAAWLALESAEGDRREGLAPRARWALLFNLSVVFGLLSQLSFILAYAALTAGWALTRLRKPLGHSRWLPDFLAWQALPLAALTSLYLFWAQHVAIGGDVFPMLRVLSRTAMLTVGLDGGTDFMALGTSIAVLLLIAGVALVARTSPERTLVYVVGILLAPAAALNWMEPSFLAPRYFLASTVFFLLLVSELLAALWRSGHVGAGLAAALLALFALGNSILAAPLLSPARNDFTRALEIMQAETPGTVIHVGSRFSFRDQLLFDYHARRLKPAAFLRFWTSQNWPELGPQWMIVTVQTEAEQVSEQLRGPRNNLYSQVASFAGLRGRQPRWHLYRVEPRRRSLKEQ